MSGLGSLHALSIYIGDLKHHDGRHDNGIPEVYFPFRSWAEPEKLIAIGRRPVVGNLVPRVFVPLDQRVGLRETLG